MKKIPAIVLGADPGLKPFWVIQEHTMLERVVRTLRSCSIIGSIEIIVPVEAQEKIMGFQRLITTLVSLGISVFYVKAGQSLTDHLKILNKYRENEKVLVVASDLPFLTPEAIEHFLKECQDWGGYDIYYPIISRHIIEVMSGSLKEIKKTYVSIFDPQSGFNVPYTGGNIFLVNPERVLDHLERIETFLDARKNLFALRKLLGLKIILRYLFKMLSFKSIEKRIFLLTGIRGKAIVSYNWGIGFDIDKPEDLDKIRNLL